MGLGSAYAVLCFFQTISMTAIPLLSGFVIDSSKSDPESTPTAGGFSNSSLLFVLLSFIGFLISVVIMKTANDSSFRFEEKYAEDDETNSD